MASPKKQQYSPQSCLKCRQPMRLAEDPLPHFQCTNCPATRDIHPDTGKVLDTPFDPEDIGDICIDDDADVKRRKCEPNHAGTVSANGARRYRLVVED